MKEAKEELFKYQQLLVHANLLIQWIQNFTHREVAMEKSYKSKDVDTGTDLEGLSFQHHSRTNMKYIVCVTPQCKCITDFVYNPESELCIKMLYISINQSLQGKKQSRNLWIVLSLDGRKILINVWFRRLTRFLAIPSWKYKRVC